IFALRSDGKVFWAQIGLPVSAATVSQTWHPSVSNTNGVTPTQIAIANDLGLLTMGTDRKLYRALQGSWTLYSPGPGVAVFGSDGGFVAALSGVSATSRTIGAIFGTPSPKSVPTLPFNLAQASLGFQL